MTIKTPHSASKRWVWAGWVLPILATLLVFGLLLCRSQSNFLKRRATENLEAIAELKIRQIVQWREYRLADGRRVKDTPGLLDIVSAWLRNPGPVETERLQATLGSLGYGGRYSQVLLVDADGRALARSKGGTTDHDELKPVLKDAFARDEVLLSDLHTDPSKRDPHMAVVCPLRPIGRGLGDHAIVLIIDADDYLLPLIESWPVDSTSAETLVVRREGDEVVFLNELRHLQGDPLSIRRSLNDVDLPASRAARGERGVIEGVDYRSKPVVAYLSPIPGSPWFMVSKIDVAEAYAELRVKGTLVGLVFAFVAVGVVGTSAVVLQRLQASHLYETLTIERARRVAEERLGVTLAAVGDAVISTDAECRVEFMNPVAESLTGWPSSEARGRPLGDVFNVVNERTRQPVENPADAVVRQGCIVGLANHTILISRDGSERAIADRGAPVRAASGEITGVVLVFRDQTEQREAERARAESKERFRTLIEVAPSAVFVQKDGVFEYLNPAACEMFGVSCEELLGTPVVDRFHPEYARGAIDRIARMNATQEPQAAAEEIILRMDGTPLTVEVSAAPITCHGVPSGVVFAHDITARRRADQAARIRLRLLELVASQSYESVLSNAVDAVCELLESPLGFFHFVEDGGESISMGPWSTATPGRCCSMEERGRHYPLVAAGVWADAIRTGEPVVHNDYPTLESRGLPEGHPAVTRELVVPILRQGRVVAAFGVGNKTTEYTDEDVELASYLADVAFEVGHYRRVEDTRRQTEEMLRMASELTRLGGWVMDFERRKLTWSDGVAALHGMPAGFAPGFDERLSFLAPECKEQVDQLISTCATTGVPFDIESQIITKDDERVWVRVVGEAVRDHEDRIVSVRGALQDITEHKRLDDELRQHRERLEELVAERTKELEASNQQLEAATRAKNRFLANMSHELRTPLNAIIGFSSVLQQRLTGDLTDQQAGQVGTINSAGKHLLSLINDVLDVSKIEAGSIEMQSVEFDAAALLEDVFRTLKPLATDKGLEISVDVPATAVPIVSDQNRVRQILVNLLGNAIKFTSEGAIAGRLEDGSDAEVMFTVTDTGPGIAEQNLPVVFEAFKQFHGEGEVKPEGAGLGLAISREFARLLGGAIEVESVAGEGSVFTLRLPRRRS